MTHMQGGDRGRARAVWALTRGAVVALGVLASAAVLAIAPADAMAQQKPAAARPAAKKNPAKSAAKAPKPKTTKPRPPARRGPSPVELEDARHNRQMGKLNRARVEATRANDTKAIARVGRQVQLELKRHQQRRTAALTKRAGAKP